MNRLDELQAIANGITDDFDLKPVTVRMNSRLRTTAGVYKPKRRVIEIAEYAWASPEVTDLLLHELAHVLTIDIAPEASDHGGVWKLHARLLGANPEAAYEADTDIGRRTKHAVKYVWFRCGEGSCEWKFSRRPRNDRAGHHCQKHRREVVAVR